VKDSLGARLIETTAIDLSEAFANE